MKTFIIALIALISTTTIKAQTADDVIAKHIVAIGGKDKLSQMNNIYIESTIEAMGNESPNKVYIINGKAYRSESDMMGQRMVQVVSDKSGWAIMPFGGSSDPTAMTDDDYKANADAIYAGDPLINYKANGAKVELEGQEKVNDINAYKIKYTSKLGYETTFYIDPSSNYIIQSVRSSNVMGQKVTVTTTYSDYKKTDYGVFMPYATNTDMGQFAFKQSTKKIEINKDIDANIFDMPTQTRATRPATPPANSLLMTGPALVSPEVGSDHRVTFRFAAPNATRVSVVGFFGGPPTVTMQKDAQGIWTGTSEPLEPEIYPYNFIVDGARVTDPSNAKLMTSYHRMDLSYLLVPGDNSWTPVPGVPRGAVTQHVYHSSVTNEEREFYVYTPPSYDPKRSKPYPILFLQHGLSEDAKSWIQQGANTTLDNLIHQGKAVPMIIVASLGYGTANGPADIDAPIMQQNFARMLTEEVMPAVYKQYNASTKATDHAIAGLSMGGGQTIFMGLNLLDKFAWFGGFSAALVNWAHSIPVAQPPASQEVVAAAEAAQAKASTQSAPPPTAGTIMRNFGAGPVFEARLPLLLPNLNAQSAKQIKLLWMGIGGDDPSIETHKQLRAYLDAKGVKYTYVEVPNQGHRWPLWHRHLAEFAQLIFK
jgi:enterochelin esterase-like enzyme